MERCGRRPRLLIYSLPFEEMCRAARSRDLKAMAGLLLEALRSLAAGGASIAIISANTPHTAWSLVEPEAVRLGVRLVSIVEAAAEKLQSLGVRSAGILATTATLVSRLYHSALAERGIEVVEPPPEEQAWLDRAISERFSTGRATDEDVARLISIAKGLASRSDAVLVACTDLSPYLEGVELESPLVDSSREQLEAALAASQACGCNKA